MAIPIQVGAQTSRQRYEGLIDTLLKENYPLRFIALHPISSIETMAGWYQGAIKGVCPIGCLACCADALHPRDTVRRFTLLSPDLFQEFLGFAGSLARRGIEIISTGRLNLFGASNELDHPDAVVFRRMLSAYTGRQHGVPLGYFSSDIVFHTSRSLVFLRNLKTVLREAQSWDNICIAIDEQMQFKDKRDYLNYIECLAEVWKILKPALCSELPHAKKTRQGEPRVILNMLVPGKGDRFRQQYLRIYRGGPQRATTYDELIQRYVQPFVGVLKDFRPERPADHKYTTGRACLPAIGDSELFIAAGIYARQGRAGRMVEFHTPGKQEAPRTIRTKLVPVNHDSVQIRAIYSSGPAAEDEIPVPADDSPSWFDTLNRATIRLG